MMKAPGLRPGTATARCLWDLHIAAVAADNPALELWPPQMGIDDPARLLDAEWGAVGRVADELEQAGHAQLTHLLRLRPPQGPPLLAVAVRYFFRRAVEEDPKLFQALAFARWEGLARSGALINLTDEMSELTLEIVLRSIFGRDLDRLSKELGGNPFEVVTREPVRDLQFAYKFRSLTKLVAQLIARRRASSEEHFDYVAMLMNARDKESGEPMGERELIDEIMTLIVAGHETTASGLNWTWYLYVLK